MELTRAEQMLLEALGAAVRGEHVDWETASGEDWKALMDLAGEQKLFALTMEAVYACPAAADVPDMLRWKQQLRGQVIHQTVKTGKFLALYERLEREGLHPLVVKGIVCRGLYPNGDHRLSADEDLLVLPEEFAESCRVLRDDGMAPTDAAADESAFEIGWRKGPLYIELHQQLFAPDSGAYGDLNAFFDPRTSHAYAVSGGKCVNSLPPHEHMLYLLLHAYKHFVHSGFGLRQVSDIGLWGRHYHEEIDWARLYAQCETAHAATFAAAVFAIAREELDIAFPLSAPWDAVQVDHRPMLKDLLGGGVYGTADKSRAHSATVTLEAVAAQRQGKRRNVLQTLFPSRKALEGRYGVLKKHPLLLPGVWCVRLLRYGKETTTDKNSSAAESLRIAKERVALLRQYDIID